MLYDSTCCQKIPFRCQSLIQPCQASALGFYRYYCNIDIAFSHWVGVTDPGTALNVLGLNGATRFVFCRHLSVICVGRENMGVDLGCSMRE